MPDIGLESQGGYELSTPSLGITSVACDEFCAFCELSTPSLGITENKLIHHMLGADNTAFNSLSRDHLYQRASFSPSLTRMTSFNSLSRDHKNTAAKNMIARFILSTPSLGITL